MTGANPQLRVPAAPNGNNHDLQGVNVPGAVAGAIAKAITGAYLSSSGNAFSTRTASMIVQEHFPPSAAAARAGERAAVRRAVQPAALLGPVGALRRGRRAGGFIGPKRSPLGLAADAGRLPALQERRRGRRHRRRWPTASTASIPKIQDVDQRRRGGDRARRHRPASTAPDRHPRRPDHASTAPRCATATPPPADFAHQPRRRAAPSRDLGGVGALTSVHRLLRLGARPARRPRLRHRGLGHPRRDRGRVRQSRRLRPHRRRRARTATRSAPAPTPGRRALTAAEVRAMLEEAFKIMSAARAQIRRPLDSRAQVTISVVDTNGAVLGIVRSPDAPIFGIDVSLQKARTAMFFSAPFAAAELARQPQPRRAELRRGGARPSSAIRPRLTGQNAFADRADRQHLAALFPRRRARPPARAALAPDRRVQPLLDRPAVGADRRQRRSRTSASSSATAPDTPQHMHRATRARAGSPTASRSSPARCRSIAATRWSAAIGVSGDGIDQDDMISFLGLHNAGLRLGSLGNAPAAIRSDQIVVPVSGASGVAAALRRLPVHPVPRHRTSRMSARANDASRPPSSSLMASAAPARHRSRTSPDSTPGPMNTGFGSRSQSASVRSRPSPG